MENLSKIANAIVSPRPELELTRITCDMLSNRNLALNPDESERVQTLVVDCYYGIQQKLGRTKIDADLVTGAIEEINEFISVASFAASDEAKSMMGEVFAKANGEGGLAENLEEMLGNLGIKVVAMPNTTATEEEVNQAINETVSPLVPEPIATPQGEFKPLEVLKDNPLVETLQAIAEATEQTLEPVAANEVVQ